MRLVLAALAILSLSAIGGIAACSSDASPNASPSCVEQTVAELPCAKDATECVVECRCTNDSDGHEFGQTYYPSCTDGICVDAAKMCESICSINGGTVSWLRDSITGASSSTSTSGAATLPPCPASSSSASSSGNVSASSSSSGNVGTSSSGGSSSGAMDSPILCDADPKLCICTKSKDTNPNGDETAACSASSVGASRCCAGNDWPSAGGCICSGAQPSCHKSSDTCICSLAAISPGETAVSSCTGKICCLEPNDVAPQCSCHTDIDSCILGGTPVPSCSTADLKCEGKDVADCRGG